MATKKKPAKKAPAKKAAAKKAPAKKTPAKKKKAAPKTKGKKADLFALAEAEDWGALDDAVLAVVHHGSVAELRALADVDVLDDALHGEQSLSARVAAALVHRAVVDEDVCGIAIAAAAYDDTAKAEFWRDVDRTWLRQALTTTRKAALRGSIANLIAVGPDAGAGDLDVVIGLLAKAPSDVGLLLAAAKLAKHAKTTTTLPAPAKPEPPLATAARALALSAAGQTLSSSLAQTLASTLAKPAKLPTSLGFRDGQTSSLLVAQALSTQPTSVTAPILGSLIEPRFKELVVQIAFGATPSLAQTPASSLSATQKTALRGFAGKAFEHDYVLRSQLGFVEAAQMIAYLDETAPLWRPIDVEGHGKLAPIHVVRGVGSGAIDVDVAQRALLRLDDEAIARLALGREEWTRTAEVIEAGGGEERDAQLWLGIVQRQEQHDPKWPERVAAHGKGRSPNAGLAVLRLVDQGRIVVDEAHFEALFDVALCEREGPTALLKKHLPAAWRPRFVERAGRANGDFMRELLSS